MLAIVLLAMAYSSISSNTNSRSGLPFLGDYGLLASPPLVVVIGPMSRGLGVSALVILEIGLLGLSGALYSAFSSA